MAGARDRRRPARVRGDAVRASASPPRARTRRCASARRTIPDAPAILFLPNADPDETPLAISHREFFAPRDAGRERVPCARRRPGRRRQPAAAAACRRASCALFGAEAAGIANPVNPLLEPRQIAEILRAARTKVLVALGPMPGTDIWSKVEQHPRPAARSARRSSSSAAQADPAQRHAFASTRCSTAQPADRLVSGRRSRPSDTAAYFHTGGTTGMPKLVRHTPRATRSTRPGPST